MVSHSEMVRLVHHCSNSTEKNIFSISEKFCSHKFRSLIIALLDRFLRWSAINHQLFVSSVSACATDSDDRLPGIAFGKPHTSPSPLETMSRHQA